MQQVGFFGTAVSATGTAAVVVDAAPVPVRPVVEATYGELLVKPKPGMAAQAEHEIVALLSERVAERNRQMAARVVGMPQDEFEVLVSVPGDSPALRQLRLQSGLIVGSMGLAALVVAGFAIFTTTLANLTERTRAIGLARAIGATRGRILREGRGRIGSAFGRRRCDRSADGLSLRPVRSGHLAEPYRRRFLDHRRVVRADRHTVGGLDRRRGSRFPGVERRPAHAGRSL